MSDVPTIKELVAALGGVTHLSKELGIDYFRVDQWTRRDNINEQHLWPIYQLCRKKRIQVRGQTIGAVLLLRIIYEARKRKAA